MKMLHTKSPCFSPSFRCGFTMVEMLAVIAVMAIIVALVVPNGIHARTVGEEQTVKAQASALEMAMATYLLQQGASAKAQYASTFSSYGATNISQYITLLKNKGALPDSVQSGTIQKAFEGYQVTMPSTLTGSVRVQRGGTAIYP